MRVPVSGAPVTLRRGFPQAERRAVAAMFWDAFAGKVAPVMGPRARAVAYLAAALRPDYALAACDGQGRVLGVAGLKTRGGGLIGGDRAALRGAYGRAGAAWRAPLLDLLDAPVEAHEVVLDGLFVAAGARGRGIGTALVGAVVAEARARGAAEVRLEVVAGNVRAQALYARLGFETRGARDHGPLRLVFGFRRAREMVRRL